MSLFLVEYVKVVLIFRFKTIKLLVLYTCLLSILGIVQRNMYKKGAAVRFSLLTNITNKQPTQYEKIFK